MCGCTFLADYKIVFKGRVYFIVKTMLEATTKSKRRKAEKKLASNYALSERHRKVGMLPKEQKRPFDVFWRDQSWAQFFFQPCGHDLAETGECITAFTSK